MKCWILWAAAIASLGGSAVGQETPGWPDTYVGRLEALALVQTLNGKILASRSATLTLESWCYDHHLADEKTIVADVVRSERKAATAEQRRRLQAGGNTEVKYRRVRLRCGTRVVSEAENWYVPKRLTAEMERLLEATDTPFGRVIQALEPYRETIAAKMLWWPLREGWEHGPIAASKVTGGSLTIPDALFEHRAIVYTGRHIPIAEVDEVYRKPLLGFAPPQ